MNLKTLRRKTFIIIFGTQTPAGKWFDLILIWLILLSVVVVMLMSIPGSAKWFRALEWLFTGLFTLEYVLRVWSVRQIYSAISSDFAI